MLSIEEDEEEEEEEEEGEKEEEEEEEEEIVVAGRVRRQIRSSQEPPRAPSPELAVSVQEFLDEPDRAGGQATAESHDPLEESAIWRKNRTEAVFRRVPRPESYNPFLAGSRGRITLEMTSSAADEGEFVRMTAREVVDLATNSSLYAAQLSAFLGKHFLTSLRDAGNLRKQVERLEKTEEKMGDEAVAMQERLRKAGDDTKEARELLGDSRDRIAELERLLEDEQGRSANLSRAVSRLEVEARSSLAAFRLEEEKMKKEKAAGQDRERKLREDLNRCQAEIDRLRSIPPPSIAELRNTPEFDEDTLEILEDGFEVTKQYLISRGFLSAENAAQASYADLIRSYVPAQ